MEEDFADRIFALMDADADTFEISEALMRVAASVLLAATNGNKAAALHGADLFAKALTEMIQTMPIDA